jgi:hypothetical protein
LESEHIFFDIGISFIEGKIHSDNIGEGITIDDLMIFLEKISLWTYKFRDTVSISFFSRLCTESDSASEFFFGWEYTGDPTTRISKNELHKNGVTYERDANKENTVHVMQIYG